MLKNWTALQQKNLQTLLDFLKSNSSHDPIMQSMTLEIFESILGNLQLKLDCGEQMTNAESIIFAMGFKMYDARVTVTNEEIAKLSREILENIKIQMNKASNNNTIVKNH